MQFRLQSNFLFSCKMILTPIKSSQKSDEVIEIQQSNPTGTPLLVVKTMGDTYTIHADQPLNADVPAPSMYQVPSNRPAPQQTLFLQPPSQPIGNIKFSNSTILKTIGCFNCYSCTSSPTSSSSSGSS